MLKGVAADGIVSVAPYLGRRGPSRRPAAKNGDRHTSREYLRVAVKVCVRGRDLGIRKVDLRFSGPFWPLARVFV
jgi:hypothetical protein